MAQSVEPAAFPQGVVGLSQALSYPDGHTGVSIMRPAKADTPVYHRIPACTNSKTLVVGKLSGLIMNTDTSIICGSFIQQ